jgi:predicted transcriptional regulator
VNSLKMANKILGEAEDVLMEIAKGSSADRGIAEIKKDIEDTQKKKDQLYARMEKDYASGAMTRARVTTYNANIGGLNDRIFELKNMLKKMGA